VYENGLLFEIKPRLNLFRTEEQQGQNCALADNKRALSVLFRRKEKVPVQNRKSAVQDAKQTDRRVARTQKLLRDALHSLIHERDYDSIVVKEILDRANVGRSAFYTHFRDKDELLVSAFHDILGTVPSSRPASGDNRNERLLWFSLPVFEHLDQLRHAGELKLGSRGRAVLHGHLHKVLAVLIAEDVKKSFRGRRKAVGQIPLDLLVQYIDSTFILVLNWWVENKCPVPPKEVNELFGSLIVPMLKVVSDQESKFVIE
jgi:AcrR family transcriptional regulator